jgi:hypothetical protein
MLAGALGAAYLSVNSARAEEMAWTKALPYAPAVDGINGKIDGLGGSLGNHGIYGARGSISIPLGGQWGTQIDLAAGDFDRRFFGSIADHLFWRNPAQGLLGVYVSHTHWSQFGGVHVTQVAGEGEYYWQRWTLQAIAGVEFGNKASQTTTTTSITPQIGINPGIPGVRTTTTFTEGYDVKTRFFDQINLKYYLTDNWDAYVGHRYLGGKHALALGTDYAVPLGGGVMASAFVEGRVGEDDFHGVWGGLRFYFGASDKPLIARHRQDDPFDWSPDSLHSLINSYFSNSSSSSSEFCSVGELINIGGTNECNLFDNNNL